MNGDLRIQIKDASTADQLYEEVLSKVTAEATWGGRKYKAAGIEGEVSLTEIVDKARELQKDNQGTVEGFQKLANKISELNLQGTLALEKRAEAASAFERIAMKVYQFFTRFGFAREAVYSRQETLDKFFIDSSIHQFCKEAASDLSSRDKIKLSPDKVISFIEKSRKDYLAANTGKTFPAIKFIKSLMEAIPDPSFWHHEDKFVNLNIGQALFGRMLNMHDSDSRKFILAYKGFRESLPKDSLTPEQLFMKGLSCLKAGNQEEGSKYLVEAANQGNIGALKALSLGNERAKNRAAQLAFAKSLDKLDDGCRVLKQRMSEVLEGEYPAFLRSLKNQIPVPEYWKARGQEIAKKLSTSLGGVYAERGGIEPGQKMRELEEEFNKIFGEAIQNPIPPEVSRQDLRARGFSPSQLEATALIYEHGLGVKADLFEAKRLRGTQ